MGNQSNVSDATAQKVDAEISRIINEQYDRAKKILEDKSDTVHNMAKALLEYETIDSDQIDEIMDGKDPTPPADWEPPSSDPDDSDSSTPSGDAPSIDPKLDGPADAPA